MSKGNRTEVEQKLDGSQTDIGRMSNRNQTEVGWTLNDRQIKMNCNGGRHYNSRYYSIAMASEVVAHSDGEQRCSSQRCCATMVGGNVKDVTLQIAQELCNDGMQKIFFFSICLMLHLALQSSRVFKVSFAPARAVAKGGRIGVLLELLLLWKRRWHLHYYQFSFFVYVCTTATTGTKEKRSRSNNNSNNTTTSNNTNNKRNPINSKTKKNLSFSTLSDREQFFQN